MDTEPPKRNPTPPPAPERTGACPFCLRKHLLKARGYAREVAEDPTREWERDNLLENLLLAEDHAFALEDEPLREGIRAVRLSFESGASVAPAAEALYKSYLNSPTWIASRSVAASQAQGDKT